MQPTRTPSDRIARMPHACEITGLSRSTLYRLVKTGELPAPIKLSAQAIGWRESDLHQFIAKRAGGSA